MRSNAAKVIPVSNAAGGDGGGDDMETRVRKLEETVGEIRENVAVIKATCATKSELAELKTELKDVQVEFFKAIASQTKWLAATVIAASVMIITVLPVILHFTK